MKLLDKVAVITGGGKGIGRAIALTFAREGANISLATWSTDLMEGVALRTLGHWGGRLSLIVQISQRLNL